MCRALHSEVSARIPRTPSRAVSKLANAASRPRQLKAGAYVGQQVVGIGFSRCVREAQVSGFLKRLLQGAGLEMDSFTWVPLGKFPARLRRAEDTYHQIRDNRSRRRRQ